MRPEAIAKPADPIADPARSSWHLSARTKRLARATGIAVAEAGAWLVEHFLKK